MDIQSRLELIKQVGEEVITEEDLAELLKTKQKPIAYDGFEPSGRIHIAQGLLRSINIGKMLKAGCKFKILVADWFAWMNNKLGGDIEKIKKAGNFMIEVWKASGLDTDKIEIIWANDVVEDKEYWKKVIQIARNNTVNRIVRCSQIMGRAENEALSAAQIFYPCMQCADIFHLGVDIPQLGLDQRKVNMLAREVGPKLGYGKPVAVHHHMLMGLGQPPSAVIAPIEKKIAMKMSKTQPDTAIFMTDSEEEIKRKINKAYCPEKVLHDNPIMDYAKHLIFEKFDEMMIERPAKYGGNLEIESYDELCEIYKEGKLFPLDLKNAVAYHTNEMLKPVRQHFERNSKAKKLMEEVTKFEITK